MLLTRVTLILAIGCLAQIVKGQDLDSSNEDSPVLLTLTQLSDKLDKSAEAKLSEDPAPALLDIKEPEQDLNEISKPSASVAPIIHSDPFFSQSSPSAASAGPAPARPSLLQAFLAGRGGATASRPNPVLDLVKNLNVTGRAGVLRERIGRFRIPRLETNEQSFAYRAGRKVGLFFQNISKRARTLAERLRARAATATPTAS